MATSVSAPRPLRWTSAFAAIVVASLVAGLLASAPQAAAKEPAKTVASKKHKKLRHRKSKAVKPKQEKPTAAPAPTATAAIVSRGQAVATTSTKPPATPKPATKPSPTPTPTPSTPTSPTTPTTPTTPPAPTSSGDSLLMQGSSISSFWLNNSAPGAITEVPDPAGSGETVFKFTVGDSDLTQGSTPNPRGELIAKPNISAGAEFWWSTKFFLPADFPAATPGFVTLLQGPFGSPTTGSPPFHIEADNGVLKFQRNATYNWDIPWQMPQVRNQWVSVMVHERFASDGFIELWINGQQVTFFSSGGYNPNRVAPTTRLEMATMDSSNNGGPNALYLQQYRKKGMYPTLTTYEGPLSIGPTRASVGG